jgi:UDP-glucose 4-epimerase
MKVVILGGSGFIGRHLARALLAAGADVCLASRQPPRQTVIASGRRDPGRLTWLPCDLGADADWTGLLAGCELLYHLAWSTTPELSNRDPRADAQTNVIGSLRLIQAAQDLGIRRIVFVSSGGTVYGHLNTVPAAEDHPTHPICAYGVSKLSVEHYLALYHALGGLDACVLRVANPYGPGQGSPPGLGAVHTFLKRAVTGQPIVIWGDGSVVRDYLYISDLVAALVAAGRLGGHRTYNIGSGEGRSLNQVVAAIEALLGRTVPVIHQAARPFDLPVNILDPGRARTELGWHPTIAFVDGLAMTLEALRPGALG